MAGTKKGPGAMAEAMKRRIEADPSLVAAREGVALDMERALARARIERAARDAPPFGERGILGRARITAPLIERLIAADRAAVEKGDMKPDMAMGSHHQAAADELRFVHALRTEGGANVAAVDWMNAGGGAKGAPLWPSGGMAGAGGGKGERIYSACVLPWVEAMQANPPQDGRGRPIGTALLVTVEAVLRSPSMRLLERLGGLRNGQARAVIRESLRRYTTWDELMQMRGKRGKAGV